MKKINKLSLYEILLVISMIVGSGLSFHKIYLYHIFMVINFFIFIYIINKNKLHFILENKIIFLFFTYSLLHIFCSKDFVLAIKNQICILCGTSILYTIKYLLKKNYYHVFIVVKKIFFFSCLIGFLEIFHIFRWLASRYSLEFPFPTVFWGNTNNYATVLIMVFPFIFFMKRSKKKLITMLATVYLLIKCDSRANNIALIVEIFIYIILIFYRSSLYKKIFIFITGIFSICLLKNKIIDKFHIFYALFYATETRMDSIGIRKMLILNLLFELKKIEVFLFGIGGGGTEAVHRIKTGKLMSSHSFFLELLVKYGIFIFILLGSYYLMLIYKNLKIYLKTSNYINGSLFVSLIGVAIGLNSMSGVIYFFPFWCLLGVADFHSNRKVNKYKYFIKSKSDGKNRI